LKKKRKKRKLKWGRIILCLIILVVVIILISTLFKNGITIMRHDVDKYLASNTNNVVLYTYEEDELKESTTLARGTKVKADLSHNIKIDETEYVKIKYDKNEYYILKDKIVNNLDDIVKEDYIYVRTASSILENVDDPKILGLAKKGEKLEVISYDEVDSDGYVKTYKIKQNDIEGYIYGKYLVYNEEDALLNYNQEVNDEIHSAIKNSYGGGDAIKLDFYPVEKPTFEDNKMPDAVYSLYLNVGVLSDSSIDSYIEFARDTKINAFVVDISDNEAIGYPSEIMKKYSMTSYEHAINSYDEYKNAISKLKEAGFYVIGRITVFKDDYYVTDNPSDAISSKSTGNPYYHTGGYWPSAYDRDVWYYKVKLALEAAEEFGFNEINFDY